ncbi:O-antigen ligase family protein [Vibrio algicola]|uniref:O-antigen ligase-related domain-containing protein n=1 Tax=Vibrio algicola TaxID=2662262 RepID=A0A5Q0TAK6_9VIBR|nr:O-antigen ligase family protein [Vibrio algicola]
MKERIYSLILFITSSWVFSGLWLTHGSLKKLTALAIIFFVYSIIFYPKIIINNIKKKSTIIILLITLLSLYAKYYHGGIFGSFTRSCLIACMISLAFNAECIGKHKIKYSIYIGLLINISFLIYTTIFSHESRPFYLMNPNIYAPVFGLFFLYFSCSTFKSRKIIDLIFSIIALYGVFIMQSRGVIVASIVALFVMSYYVILRQPFKLKIKALILLIPVLLSTLLINTSIGMKLYNKTNTEYDKIESGNLNTSIGFRIQMGIIAKNLIAEKPFVGQGDNFYSARKEIIKDKNYNTKINNFKTLHNVYSDSWVKLGLLGFIISILLTISPLLILKGSSDIALGLSFTIFTFSISMVDTALLGGEYLLMLIALTSIYKYQFLTYTDK